MPATPISPSRPKNRSVPGSRRTEGIQTSTPRPLHHPGFVPVLQYLRQELYPLVSCTTGEIPTDFPETMLSYHLLTNNQLDNLAQHYHQTSPPLPQTSMYPSQIQKPWLGPNTESNIDLETKRRRFGRFIGLGGCNSPVATEHPQPTLHLATQESSVTTPIVIDEAILSNILTPDLECEDVWEMMARMEQEWQAALAQAQAEDNQPFGWK
ncbi:hypothetical protein N7466_003179 [Penicillium verhagenii]|uniref:uncharacterized protein n=1 Tax=Penicillium verhagenii TaxID=1562060 RepID=UPI0025451538|nr:uncharacterized protein N7466_003179 [Penicillium verhagenii]KAJ5936729.1 hypothetical protein N7466_003179 [Penicillium verhagenii]